MNLLQFFLDHDKRECRVTFGIPFSFRPLSALPTTKDGKATFVLGTQPHTIEKVISIPYEQHMDAFNVCNWYSNQVEVMIRRLEALDLNVLV